jgi:RHH-type proline utilization regulon transcriptional repressor/proline dehydrogenase/delta 1-pyrroline-5-carboxylate dehydrogenase
MKDIRAKMREDALADDSSVIAMLQADGRVSLDLRDKAQRDAVAWVENIRGRKATGLMDIFMAEYGLSNAEGVSLMCLAEALLRVPDAGTMDALIEDKIAPSNWASHLGRSSSPLVNASTWALLLTGKVLDEKSQLSTILHGMIKRLGEPMIRGAVKRAMRELGAQFVLGQSIKEAIKNGAGQRKNGYTYSYDMLGEAAQTSDDALEFFNAYADAIQAIEKQAKSSKLVENPGISIKLSALFERYELTQKDRVMNSLVSRVLLLSQMAKKANIGLNIDAEEAARLELSMDIIEKVLSDSSLENWDGFGIVVQAYGKRAKYVIDWFYNLAKSLNRRVTVRLVKGAYWDTEIKLAQVEGLEGFPVFSSKPATDISYIENAAHLFACSDVIYPQFATHNAHTIAMVKAIAGEFTGYEFQRLHGMGETLYDVVREEADLNCRIYAPVGVHEDLLAYLVRRLLENGANSSFVNQILDKDTPAIEVAADPYEIWNKELGSRIQMPKALFFPRKNSQGWDLFDVTDLNELKEARDLFKETNWQIEPITVNQIKSTELKDTINPATNEKVGQVRWANKEDCENAVLSASLWEADVKERAKILCKAADIYEDNFGEIISILTREAGKTLQDAIAELREAVDFLRYYADEAQKQTAQARGIFVCISPWNFPLAIFTGQIAAALSAGNGVLAKPAEATSIMASRAINWLHQAGVPLPSLQLILGAGNEVGNALTSNNKVAGICFTGSTQTAQSINRNIATSLPTDAVLIAETGGLNAMIIDSTALPEQAVRDIVISSFQSAGQRCSACRVLFIQQEIWDKVVKMLFGAMDSLLIGDPWDIANDIGPVIDETAKKGIENWIEQCRKKGKVLKQTKSPSKGWYVPPTVIELENISELEKEIFGPVLHLIPYKSDQLNQVVDSINNTGYGLTFGLHSRIDDKVEYVCENVKAGNIYINRNQIGAIVGSQPFGGRGLSGTGPKAGGPLYLHRFYKDADMSAIQKQQNMPGPTGESNSWSIQPRGKILCLGPSIEDAEAQAKIAEKEGCTAEIMLELTAIDLLTKQDFAGIVYWGKEDEKAKAYRQALSMREGEILPFISTKDFAPYLWVERHICVDTTASGGNAELLAG